MISVGYIHKRLYEGINHRLRTFAGGRLASYCRPTSIALMLTEHCTARCVHCDIWKNTAREENPEAAQWKQLVDDLADWLGPVHVFITGGEALMKPYAIDLVAHARRRGLFLELLTHGFWADQAKIERLALAEPWCVTISLDGLGADHDTVRGRTGFFDKTSATIATLERVRAQHRLDFTIRLKFVIMAQNLHAAADVARFAAARAREGAVEVFYQPIEQNYNTPENPRWFETSTNWPTDREAAVHAVKELIELKKQGLPIANSVAQLEVMIPYFRDPDALRVVTQGHSAHERRPLCHALSTLEVRSSGDVMVCMGIPPVGNIKQKRIRDIWEQRPRVWESGCCLNNRCSDTEKAALSLPVIS